MKKVSYFILSYLALCLDISGCGNISHPNVITSPMNGVNYSLPNVTSTSANNMNCTNMPNINPQLDVANTSLYYTVCPSSTAGDYTDIWINTQNPNSNVTLCVYAAQEWNSTAPGVNMEPLLDSTGVPLVQCNVQITNGSAEVSFDSMPSDEDSLFNAVYIVPQTSETAMTAWLLEESATPPSYSSGKFR